MAAIRILIAGTSVAAELNESDTALRVLDALPIESSFDTWGDEIYFTIPVQAGLQDGRAVVDAGDIGYWPPGNALCIFYGTTPASNGNEIRPASPVTLIGRIEGDPAVFRKLAGKSSTIRIERA